MMIEALALLVLGILWVALWEYDSNIGPLSGQPYAFRQAGLTMAIVLLVSLTVVVRSQFLRRNVQLSKYAYHQS